MASSCHSRVKKLTLFQVFYFLLHFYISLMLADSLVHFEMDLTIQLFILIFFYVQPSRLAALFDSDTLNYRHLKLTIF